MRGLTKWKLPKHRMQTTEQAINQLERKLLTKWRGRR